MAAHAERTPQFTEAIEERSWVAEFPWWLLIILGIIGVMGLRIAFTDSYGQAFESIVPGLRYTFYVTAAGFILALILGLVAGLGRLSDNIVLRNLATAYIEFIRGVPVVVLILTFGFVLVPMMADAAGVPVRNVPMALRAIIALAVIYGAFLAEVFRAGVESVPPGQMEAARSVGMTHVQAMRYIILPQAIRNILPALGNDLIAILKDSSLVSLLAVREITQEARLFTASTFRYAEGYLVLTVLYLSMTTVLSLLLQWYQAQIRKDAR
ncbi:MAG: amino acid ABC transporter permease [Chloroflexota bacterium]|nr:amino acid ABC transporter permease [Chloroflexota bacterium]